MKKVKKDALNLLNELNEKSRPTHETIQNPQVHIWPNFDVFWAQMMKGGTHVIKDSIVAHLKATGAWEDQSKWIPALLEFGVPVENKKT